MKKIAVMILAAFSMAAAVPVFAAEMDKETKDQCLLASKGCAHETKTIQQKIKALDVEIKKGKKVYSADEIKKLEIKLKEANELLDNLLQKP